MSLQDLFALDKAGSNPIQKLVNNFTRIDHAFSGRPSFPQGSMGDQIATKLDSTRELIEELKKLTLKDFTGLETELAQLDLTEANKIFETLKNEEPLMLQLMLEGAWNQAQEDRRITQDFASEFLALEEAYNIAPIQVTTNTMTKIDHSAAQEIYHQVDKDGSLYSWIIQQMRDYGSLPGFISDIGKMIIQEDKKKTVESLKPKLIAIAEAINKGFNDAKVAEYRASDINFNNYSKDELFKVVLGRLDYALLRQKEFFSLTEEACDKMMGEIYNLYDMT